MSSGLASGYVLTARSLEPAYSVSLSLSAPPPLTLCLCFSKNEYTLQKNIKKKKAFINPLAAQEKTLKNPMLL